MRRRDALSSGSSVRLSGGAQKGRGVSVASLSGTRIDRFWGQHWRRCIVKEQRASDWTDARHTMTKCSWLSSEDKKTMYFRMRSQMAMLPSTTSSYSATALTERLQCSYLSGSRCLGMPLSAVSTDVTNACGSRPIPVLVLGLGLDMHVPLLRAPLGLTWPRFLRKLLHHLAFPHPFPPTHPSIHPPIHVNKLDISIQIGWLLSLKVVA